MLKVSQASKFARLKTVDRVFKDKTMNLVHQWVEHYAGLFLDNNTANTLSEAQKDDVFFIIGSFSEFCYSHFLIKPGQWTQEVLEDVCANIMPRKITAEDGLFENIVPVLSCFLSWVGKEGYMTDTSLLVKRLEKANEKIVENAKNPACWGVSKTLGMQAIKEGVDMNDMDAVNAFFKKQIGKKIPNFAN